MVQYEGAHLELHDESSGRLIEAGWDAPPRWLRYTGLPQVLGQSPMDCLDLLLRRTLGHRTRERPPMDRDGQTFPAGTIPWTHGELSKQIGCSEKTTQRAVGKLIEKHLVMVSEYGYRLRDGTSVPTWGQVSLELLERVYVVTASEIPVEMGGLALYGEPDEVLQVRLFQGNAPIKIRRVLGADHSWEVPLPLVRALLNAPGQFEAVKRQKIAALSLRDDCERCARMLAAGRRVDASGLRTRLAGLTWAPKALVETVENLVDNVGKSQ